MNYRDHSLLLKDINGEDSCVISFYTFERAVLEEKGIVLKGELDPSEVSYLKYLKSCSQKPIIGNRYIVICFTIIHKIVKIYGDRKLKKLLNLY